MDKRGDGSKELQKSFKTGDKQTKWEDGILDLYPKPRTEHEQNLQNTQKPTQHKGYNMPRNSTISYKRTALTMGACSNDAQIDTQTPKTCDTFQEIHQCHNIQNVNQIGI